MISPIRQAFFAKGLSALALAAMTSIATGTGALAADPVKIGMVTTLSGPAGYLGEDARDGFMLAVAEEGGMLGGVPVDVMIEDDGLKPVNGKAIAERFLDKDKAEIITGVIFSNIAAVVAPMTLKAGSFYISPNAAPSIFAGKKCDPDYFAVAWQNDTLHETAGIDANNLGYKSAVILAPNYQAGKDALAGFKRYFKGEVKDEIYTKLGQTDYAAEIAKIRAAKPEMVFHFLPGGMGINFLKQYAQAGLKESIPLVLGEPSADLRIVTAVGDIALGIHSSTHWNLDFDNEASKTFVKGFEEKYGREPTVYASQGYDTAKLIASALKATGGKVLTDKDAFRAALEKADFASVRGPFKFNTNHHPIMNWYDRLVMKEGDKIVNKTQGLIVENHQDAFVGECKM